MTDIKENEVIQKTEESVAEEKLTAEMIEEERKKLEAVREEQRKKTQDALAAMAEGKGILKLNTPIKSGGESIEELPYDFTALTGLEYTQAMDSDPKSSQLQKITHRQGLALFATSASKYVDRLDMQDILQRISAADAIEAIELATIFFAGSMRAGRMRISKK